MSSSYSFPSSQVRLPIDRISINLKPLITVTYPFWLTTGGDALIFELAVSTGYSPGAGLSSLLELEAGLSTLLSQKGLVFLPTGLEWFPVSGMSYLLIAYIIRLGVLMRALARLEDLDLRGPPQIH